MKNQPKNILLAAASLLLILGTSCKKDLVEKYEKSGSAGTATAKTTAELKVSSSFDWKTSQLVNLEMKGAATYPAMVLTADGAVLSKSLLKSGELVKSSVVVPAGTKTIKVNYMGKIREFEITGNTLKLDL